MRRLATFLLEETTNLMSRCSRKVRDGSWITYPLILCIKPIIWVIEIHLHLVNSIFYLAMLILLLWSNQSLWRSHNQPIISKVSKSECWTSLCRKKQQWTIKLPHIRPLKTFYLITQTIPLGWTDSPIIGLLFFFSFQEYLTNHAQSCCIGTYYKYMASQLWCVIVGCPRPRGQYHGMDTINSSSCHLARPPFWPCVVPLMGHTRFDDKCKLHMNHNYNNDVPLRCMDIEWPITEAWSRT